MNPRYSCQTYNAVSTFKTSVRYVIPRNGAVVLWCPIPTLIPLLGGVLSPGFSRGRIESVVTEPLCDCIKCATG